VRVRGEHWNCQVLWAAPAAQRSVTTSILFGISGTVLVGWVFFRSRPHWIYYLLGAIYVGLCWRGAISLARHPSRGPAASNSARVSLSALGFQLALVALVVGIVRAQVSAGSVPLLLMALVLVFAWVAFALVAVSASDIVRDERWLGLDGRCLVESLRVLTGGLPRKDLDPVGCALSVLLFVAVSWLAVAIWILVGLLVPSVSAAVFAAPGALTAAWARRRSPRALLPVLALVWLIAFGALTEGVSRSIRAFIAS
jgi:hypothetical protein